VKSASDGCDLCKLFLHGYLDNMLGNGRFRYRWYKNKQEAQDSLLAREQVGLRFKDEETMFGGKKKDWYSFQVRMSASKFLESGIENENQEHWGYTVLELLRGDEAGGKGDASFFVTSESGKIIP
jgi:hypothetical protein